METTPFGTLPDGRTVRLFSLTNAAGLSLQLSEFGATVIAVRTPDRGGQLATITLAEEDFAHWLRNPAYLGSTVGRYGNRIAGGRFDLADQTYELATNNDPGGLPCHLHGGTRGFSHLVWKGEPVIRPNAQGVEFTLHSAAGDEGYPGNLTAKVTYWLTRANELIFEATATTDAATPINLINHTYWNLSGDLSSDILSHHLQLQAEHFLPTNAGLIPSGEKAPVKDTPMDFTRSTIIGERIGADYQPLKLANGYDHCWVVSDEPGQLQHVATVHEPQSGRTMEVLTDQVGVQFYTGNFLPQKHGGFCLETQAFPDSPNQPEFPSTILEPGQTYRHTCIFRFSAK